jgi:hypothetical protein
MSEQKQSNEQETPSSDSAEEQQEEQQAEEEREPDAVQARFDQLSAQIHKEKREKEQLREDVKFARKTMDEFQRTIEELKSPSPADDPPPGEDADITEVTTWMARQMKRLGERSDERFDKINEGLAIEAGKNRMRAKHADFEDMLEKYETKFTNDPALKQKVTESAEPFQTFYDEAKKFEAEIETALEKETGKSAQQTTETGRSGGPAKEPAVSDKEFAQVQRIWGAERFPDKATWLKAKQVGDKHRAEGGF